MLIATERHRLGACRYVVLNPVAAGICDEAGEWPWSSYAATAGLAAVPPFLTVATTLADFGSDREQAQARYRAWVADGAAELRAARQVVAN